jgi:hypothetical protein
VRLGRALLGRIRGGADRGETRRDGRVVERFLQRAMQIATRSFEVPFGA